MAERGPSDWLAVFGHPAGLAWVLSHARLIFPAERAGLPVVTEQQRTLSAIIAGEIMALAFVAV